MKLPRDGYVSSNSISTCAGTAGESDFLRAVNFFLHAVHPHVVHVQVHVADDGVVAAMQPVVQLTQEECLGLIIGGGGAGVVACEICSHRVLVHNGALLYFCAKLLQRAGAHGRRGAVGEHCRPLPPGRRAPLPKIPYENRPRNRPAEVEARAAPNK